MENSRYLQRTDKSDPDINIIRLYMDDISGPEFSSLLSREEEVELSKRVTAGTLIKRDGDTAGCRKEDLTPDALEAVNTFIVRNQGLVLFVTQKKQGRGLSFGELVDEGNKGLHMAARRFDHTQGRRFSTYAVPWINHFIELAITDQGRPIRIPVAEGIKRGRIIKAAEKLEQQKGQRPSINEIAEDTGISPNTVTRLLGPQLFEPVSTDVPVENTKDVVKGDLIPDNSNLPEEITERLDTKDFLYKLLSRACNGNNKDRTMAIIAHRYGLSDGDNHTMEETGLTFGITKERVCQIEEDVLTKMRILLAATRCNGFTA
jgi:DNA-directed RNA polymerase sigma subunit (sigma70/sigma32)